MNKMSMEMMQMNMRPMMITFVAAHTDILLRPAAALLVHGGPLAHTAKRHTGGLFPASHCTAEQAADPEHVCQVENALYLWAWYFLSSIAFSGLIMKVTKTSMDLG